MVDNKYFEYEEKEEDNIGICEECEEVITNFYAYCTDNKGNLFCSEECAGLYYGIREV